MLDDDDDDVDDVYYVARRQDVGTKSIWQQITSIVTNLLIYLQISAICW